MSASINHRLLLFSLLGYVVLAVACSALQPPDANGPRSDEPPYPVVFADDSTRQSAFLAWQQLAQRYGLSPKNEPQFQPITGTLQSLPANLTVGVYLPKVGNGPTPTEEDIRESLRRFILAWKGLTGVDPSQLSLVERKDEASGVRLARYEQRPFRYPLRGGYGNLVIHFASDWRLLDISSNCLANTDRLQADLNAVTPKLSAEDAQNHIKGRSVSFTDTAGNRQSFTIPLSETGSARQLVVYAMPSNPQSTALEFHLAWEIDLAHGPVKTVYLDSVTDQIIAAS